MHSANSKQSDTQDIPWPGGLTEIIRSLLWTALFCAAIGLLLWLLNISPHLGYSMASSFCIGGCVWSAQVLLGDRLEAWAGHGWRNILATTIGLAFALGLLAIWAFSNGTLGPTIGAFGGGTILLAGFFAIVGTAIFSNMAQVHIMEQALNQEKIERLESERQLTEARLKTLQAQIEPHFLFNTLSNAVGMIRSNPAAAEETLQQLTTLLRNSLGRTRDEQTSLGEELDVLNAYLRIQQLRMGERLTFSVQCPSELRTATLPPLLIQPLVENAVQHGLERAEAGGHVAVTVTASGAELIIQVCDTGLGLNTASPAGTGLTNVRERLRSLYGKAANLRLSPNDPNGVIATVTLPQ